MPVEWRNALTELPLEVLNGIPQHKYQVSVYNIPQISEIPNCRSATMVILITEKHRRVFDAAKTFDRSMMIVVV